MASIQTGIRLNDQFSAVLNHIVSAVNMAVSQMEAMQQTVGRPVDTAGFDAVREEANRAQLAVSDLEGTIRQMANVQAGSGNTAAMYAQTTQNAQRTGNAIQENTGKQNQFNQAVKQGNNESGGLLKTIKGVVAAYATAQTAKAVINASDELTQTTSRVELMNQAFNQMNQTEMETSQLMDMIYASAQNARGSFGDMAELVARFGNNARDAFSSQEEVISFANLLQKQMTIAGASTEEASNAMLQLSQALGSGVLRGDELNSIFEQAPNLIQNIADYLDVPIGRIREMAAEGQLSADVVKAAVFNAAGDINSSFEQMPKTWGQIWTEMKNTALMAFQPVLARLNEIANSQEFQAFLQNETEGMQIAAGVILRIMDLVGQVGNIIYQIWPLIGPLIYGVIGALVVYAAYLAIVKGQELAAAAATMVMAVAKGLQAAAMMLLTGATWAETTAQLGLNSAMYACPIVWIIILIIALIAIIYAVCNAIAKLTGIAQSGFGLITGVVATALAFIGNLVIGFINSTITLIINFYNMVANFAAAFGILFDDPVAAIKAVILSMFNFIVGIVSKAAAMLDAVFGSNLQGAVAGFQGKVQSEINATIEGAGGKTAKTLDASDYTLDRFDYGESFQAGASWGDGVANNLLNGLKTGIPNQDILNPEDYTSMFQNSVTDGIAGSGLPASVGDTAGNTGRMADALGDSEEDLKYLRDIAERDTINRYTTAEIRLEMTNHNTINSDLDLDGVVDYLTSAAEEAIAVMAEGAHP